jgi:hypothetical protein
MNISRLKIFGCLLLIGIGVLGLYGATAEDYSFLKEASGSETCWTCTNMWKCGGNSYGVQDCGPVNDQGKCDPTSCTRSCPEGAINRWCKNTTPLGGECEVVYENCTLLTRYKCLRAGYGPPHCICTSSYTQGYCARQNC